MHIRVALFLVLATLLTAPVASALSEKITTQRFVIHHTQGDYLNSRRVADAAEESWVRISKNLGYNEPKHRQAKLPIYVYPNREDFVEATGTDRRELTLGRAHSGLEKIELNSDGVLSSVETITEHEIAHIIVFRLTRGADIPLWLHEGIAKVESNDWTELDNQLISDAVIGGKMLSLRSIRTDFPKGANSLAYAQSGSFIRFFIREYGKSGLQKLLLESSKGSFEDAVKSVTGKDVQTLEDDWLKSVRREYAPYIWVRFVGTAAMGILPILVLLAYLAVRRKKRAQLQRYLEEEWEEANKRDWGNSWPGGGLQ